MIPDGDTLIGAVILAACVFVLRWIFTGKE